MPNRRPEAHDPPLLITENRATFTRIYDSLLEDLDTRAAIERILISSMAQARIEIERYDRAATAVINVCIRPALVDLLNELLRDEDEWPWDAEEDAETIAARWFTDDDTKENIARSATKTQPRRVGDCSESNGTCGAANRAFAALDPLGGIAVLQGAART